MTQRKGRQSRNEIWREMEGKGKEKRDRAAMEEFCKNIFGRGGGKSFFFFFFFFLGGGGGGGGARGGKWL